MSKKPPPKVDLPPGCSECRANGGWREIAHHFIGPGGYTVHLTAARCNCVRGKMLGGIDYTLCVEQMERIGGHIRCYVTSGALPALLGEHRHPKPQLDRREKLLPSVYDLVRGARRDDFGRLLTALGGGEADAHASQRGLFAGAEAARDGKSASSERWTGEPDLSEMPPEEAWGPPD